MKKRTWKKIVLAICIFSFGFVVSTIYHIAPQRLKEHGIGAVELSSLIETPYGVSSEDGTLVIYGKPCHLPYVTDDYEVHYYCELQKDNTISVTDKSGISFNSPNIKFYSEQAIKLYSYETHKKNGKKYLTKLINPKWESEIFIFNMEHWENEYTESIDFVTLYFQYEYWDKKENSYLHPFVSLKIYI